jgi:predicted RNase H-like nuclease (RuvC/YqgF family)
MDIRPDLRSQEEQPTGRAEQLEKRVTDLEKAVARLEKTIEEQGGTVERLESDVADLEARGDDQEWLRLAFRALVADLDHALGIKFMPISVRLQIEALGQIL